MAPKSGTDSTPLIEKLIEDPESFEFFQAVRLLTKLDPAKAPVGGDADPEDEAVRFSSTISFHFPRSDIVSISNADEEDAQPRMEVYFMGVASPTSYGSLPLRYTEHILTLQKMKSFAFRDFIDIFNHRSISMFYRAVAKHNLAISHEQDDRRLIEKILLSLIGMGLPDQGDRFTFNDRALLARTGLLGRRPLPAVSLENLILSYFRVKAEVRQFCPRWYKVEDEELTRLGRENSILGLDLLLGSNVQLAQFGFRIKLGPLGKWKEIVELNLTASSSGLNSVLLVGRIIRVFCQLEMDSRPLSR